MGLGEDVTIFCCIFVLQSMSMKFEEEKEEIKRNMTVKLKQKQEALTLRLQKQEQEKTASLVQKHSEQMLQLMSAKREEIRTELEHEMVSVVKPILC